MLNPGHVYNQIYTNNSNINNKKEIVLKEKHHLLALILKHSKYLA